MNAILTPAKLLMERLRYIHKFILIFVLFLVPMLVLSSILLSEINSDIRLVEKERQGLAYVKATRGVLEEMLQQRGMVYAYLMGDQANRQRAQDRAVRIKDRFAALEEIDQRLGETLETGDRVRELRSQWQQLHDRIYDMRPTSAMDDYSGLIADVNGLIAHVADTSKLIIRLPHIDSLNNQAQRLLQRLIAGREQGELQTWILATTTGNLEERVNDGQFSAKLYYKIGFETLLVPPLRHRPEDVKATARRYVEQAGKVLNLQFNRLDEAKLEELTEQEWPGNFPQLYKVLRRSLLESDEDEFQLRLKEKQQYQLFPEQKISEDAVLGFDEMNRKYLERVLELTDGKIYGDDGAAALLNLKPTTLQSKLKRLGIK